MRLARVLKFRLQQVEVLYLPGSEQQRRLSDCAEAQADLRLWCSLPYKSRFSHDVAHLKSASYA